MIRFDDLIAVEPIHGATLSDPAVHPLNESQPNLRKIVSYLNTATMILPLTENEPDLFAKDSQIPGGTSLRSDGTFVWRDSLAHYCRNYNTRLPQDFIAHMERHDYKPPPIPEDNTLSLENEAWSSGGRLNPKP